jgi:thiol-disulfide isomerase/thioredoxin
MNRGTNRMTARRRWITTAALALLVSAVSVPLRAQAIDALFQGFEPWGEWLLKIDGAEVPKAQIYRSQRSQSILVRSAALPAPVLLDVPGRSVSTLDPAQIAVHGDGTIDLLADAKLTPAGSFSMLPGGGAAFEVAGKHAELAQNPFLLGPHDGFELLDHDAHYHFLADRYEPDSAAIDKLRKEKRDVRVLTFFGSWCPHCREHVPLLLKTEEELSKSKIEFQYFGLPPAFWNTPEPEAKKYGVTGVPTSIVFVGGKEIGRIPNSGWAHPDVALAELLSAPQQASGDKPAAPAGSGR